MRTIVLWQKPEKVIACVQVKDQKIIKLYVDGETADNHAIGEEIPVQSDEIIKGDDEVDEATTEEHLELGVAFSE